MYSLILMTAMGTAAPEAPNHGLRCLLGPRPVGCSGCWGWSCGGGCWGACYGRGCWGSCAGCWGSCTGCRGVVVVGCGGCVGCVGAPVAYGPVTYGPIPLTRSVWGANYQYSGSTPFSPPSYVPGSVKPEELMPNPKLKDTSARVIIDVPSTARLYIDDIRMRDGSGERLFRTPALAAGKAFYYDVRVELEKDGKLITESKRVVVRAGDTVRESFAKLNVPAAITVADGK